MSLATLSAAIWKSQCHNNVTPSSQSADSAAIAEFQKITPISADTANATPAIHRATPDKHKSRKKKKQPTDRKNKNTGQTPSRDITSEQVSP